MKKITSKNGVTMVETAAMLFFIFVLLGLIITGGQMVSNKSSLNYATQAAVRAAAVQPTKSKAENKAKEVAVKILKENGLSITNTTTTLSAPSGWDRGDNFSITVSTSYKTLFPLIGAQSAGSRNSYMMTSRVVAMVEARN